MTGIQYVYFVQGETTRRIKIGKSHDPVRRLQALRTGSGERLNFLGCLPLDLGWDEASVHDHFDAHRVRGEWFAPDLELRRFVAQHAVTIDGLDLVPPFPPAGVGVPTVRVWWRQLPVIDFDRIRSELGA